MVCFTSRRNCIRHICSLIAPLKSRGIHFRGYVFFLKLWKNWVFKQSLIKDWIRYRSAAASILLFPGTTWNVVENFTGGGAVWPPLINRADEVGLTQRTLQSAVSWVNWQCPQSLPSEHQSSTDKSASDLIIINTILQNLFHLLLLCRTLRSLSTP